MMKLTIHRGRQQTTYLLHPEQIKCSRCGDWHLPDEIEECFEDLLCKKCVKEITKFDDQIMKGQFYDN